MCSWCSSWTPRTVNIFLDHFLAWNIFHMIYCFDDPKTPRCSPYIILHRHVLKIPKQQSGRPKITVKLLLTVTPEAFLGCPEMPENIAGTVFKAARSTSSRVCLFHFMVSGKSSYIILPLDAFKQHQTTHYCQTCSSFSGISRKWRTASNDF